MAAIDLSSISAPLNDGILQLQNGVAMSSTLTSVTDQSNTASTLKLSTTSAQFTSPLRITTDDPSDFYLDCEDGSTNNRFSITRNTASQQVNLNFASNPAGSTTIVGAVRTYVDGVNLSEVMAFREDGFIGMGTPNPSNKVEIRGANFTNVLRIGGANTGRDFLFNPYYATNTYGGFFSNESGNITLGASLGTDNGSGIGIILGAPSGTRTALLQVKGSGSTSATTSLLVQNSSGTELFRINDAGNFNLGQGRLNWGGIGFGSYIQSDGYDILYNTRQDSKVHIFYVGGNPVFGINRYSATDYRVYMGIGSGNEASAILEVKSSTQGFLPPRMTDAQIRAIATPAEGLIAYNTTISHLCCYQAGAWVKFSHSPM